MALVSFEMVFCSVWCLGTRKDWFSGMPSCWYVTVIVVVHIDFVTVAVATTAVVILPLMMFVCDCRGFYLAVFRVSSDAAFLLVCVWWSLFTERSILSFAERSICSSIRNVTNVWCRKALMNYFCVFFSVSVLKDLPSHKLAKIADVLEIVSI